MTQPPQTEQRLSFSLAAMEELEAWFDTLNHGQVKRIKAKLQADVRPVTCTLEPAPASVPGKEG